MSHQVRIAQEPGTVRLVNDFELVDLARQRLLFSYKHTADTVAVLGGMVKTPGEWESPARDEKTVTPSPAVTNRPVPSGQKGA